MGRCGPAVDDGGGAGGFRRAADPRGRRADQRARSDVSRPAAGSAGHRARRLRLRHRRILRLRNGDERYGDPALQDAHPGAAPGSGRAVQRHGGLRGDAHQRLCRHVRARAQVGDAARPRAGRDRRPAIERQHHPQALQSGPLRLAQHPGGRDRHQPDRRAGRHADQKQPGRRTSRAVPGEAAVPSGDVAGIRRSAKLPGAGALPGADGGWRRHRRRLSRN